ncbi:MAG: hypothetical protein K2X47_11440, partial [Bdellovibrionales bacterium]|nr:hypothetical protein [Bdellovibrionales bacterium]
MVLEVTPYQYVPLAFYLVNVLAFGWGAIFFFRQQGPVSPRYRGVQVASIATWVVQAWFLAPTVAASTEVVVTVGIGFLGTLWLFVWAIQATREARLSLIYSDDLPSFIVRNGPYRFF